MEKPEKKAVIRGNHMNKKRRAIIASNEISELKEYTLNGYAQKVLVEGKKRTNPIVIFLHGGPGSPIPFCEGCRGMFPELTEQFTMVYWDQLGCGINNCLIDDFFSVDTFVKMTIDLVRQIGEDYKGNPINIFAVSWGSILAAKVAEAIPGLLNRVVIYGQVLKQLSFNEEVFAALDKTDLPKKQKERLLVMRQSPVHSLEELKTIMGWIGKYTEGYQSKKGGKTPIGSILIGLLGSPDYSLKDFKAIVVNGYMKNKSLLTELMGIDLSETLKRVDVPYLILQGDTDIVTSTSMVSNFVKAAGNDKLHYLQVENSGHLPSAGGMDMILDKGFEFLKQ